MLKGDENVLHLVFLVSQVYIQLSKLCELYTLNGCSLPNVNYTSVKLTEKNNNILVEIAHSRHKSWVRLKKTKHSENKMELLDI